jgi:hypothetical protein
MGAVYRSGQKLQTFHIKVNRRAPTAEPDWENDAVLRKGLCGLESPVAGRLAQPLSI